MKKPAYEIVDDEEEGDRRDDSRRTNRLACCVVKWLCLALACGCWMFASWKVFTTGNFKADNVYQEIQLQATQTHAYAIYLPAVVWMLVAGFFQREEHRRDA